MEEIRNADMKKYLSMRLNGQAGQLIVAKTEQDVFDIWQYTQDHEIDLQVIGSGTNTLQATDYFTGAILQNGIMGVSIYGKESVIVEVGAGESLDALIETLLEQKIVGLESLSGIPGTVGAAPVQNAGAYGKEIGDHLVWVRALNRKTGKFSRLLKKELDFGYRHSIFNSTQKNEWIITAVALRLDKVADAQDAWQRRQEVLTLRAHKIPSPEEYPNCGSFFKNPMIGMDEFKRLKQQIPDIKGWEIEDKVKLSAGQLLLKTYPEGLLLNGMRIDVKSPLILMNEKADSYEDLKKTVETIREDVYKTFGILLEQEVNMYK